MEQDKHNTIIWYTSPEVKVMEVKAKHVLCQSLGYPTEFEEENDN